MRRALLVIIALSLLAMLCPEPVEAEGETVRKDSNKDGKIDQIAHFSASGKLIKLEIDSNADEVMDRFQYYEDGQIKRAERDSNLDRTIDCWDYFQKGQRVRQERVSPQTGQVEQIIDFDSEERPLKIERDTTADGLLDTVYYFEQGALILSTKDTNGDGRAERITLFDPEGLPKESGHDLDRDGNMEVVRLYRQGELWEQKKDLDQNGQFEILTRYKDGQPCEQHKDANGDGRFDIVTRFKAGLPAYQEKDTNFDGNKDISVRFDAEGNPEKVEEDTRHTGGISRIRTYRNGELVNVVCDEDGDGFKETVTLFSKGKASLQTQDKNKDGKADMKIYFNAQGIKERVEGDTDLDGRTDAWEYYRNGELARVERDDGGNGKVDLKVLYKHGKRQKLLRDKDGDGRFEITQWFNKAPWSMVMELDVDADGKPEGRYCYQESVLRLKEIDENSDGTPDLREHYNAQGKLAKSEENDKGVGRFAITWFYNDAEDPIRAEEDNNSDGKVDTWYSYHKGSLATVEEDTNGDGKPDLWEEYDEAEALVKRLKDLNFDGEPDMVDFSAEGQAPSAEEQSAAEAGL